MISLPLLLFASLASSGGAPAQAAPPEPADVLAMLYVDDPDEPIQAARARRARYVSIMAALAARPAPPDADPSAEAEVVRVARGAAIHPEQVRELFGFYVTKVENPRARLVVSPLPQGVHLDARYRYAWEYLFLLPGDRERAPGYAQSALEALAKIHDDDSLPLIVESFTGLDPIYRRDYSVALQEQQQMLPRIGDFVSERGLDAVIRCADDMRAAQAKNEVPLAERTQMDRLVGGMLQPRFSTERAAAWAEVIAAYRRKPEKRARLATLNRYLDGSSKP